MGKHRYLNCRGRIPNRIRRLAMHRLSDYRQQFIGHRVTRNKGHWVINVTRNYRLLSRNQGRWWFLMPHSLYDIEVDL